MIDGAVRLVATALDYPFARPDHSFLFVDGAVEPFSVAGAKSLDAALTERGAAPIADRTAVLAYGANAAPERLQQKFAPLAPGMTFPVVKAQLFDFDVVYACHYSGYGALPATLAPSPGTIVEIAVTYLDAAQLARMHETELAGRSYVFGLLQKMNVTQEGLEPLREVHCYWTGYGCFADASGPRALAAVNATGRNFATAAQEDMQTHILNYLSPGRDLHDFVHENIADPALRQERSLALRADAQTFEYSHCELLKAD